MKRSLTWWGPFVPLLLALCCTSSPKNDDDSAIMNGGAGPGGNSSGEDDDTTGNGDGDGDGDSEKPKDTSGVLVPDQERGPLPQTESELLPYTQPEHLYYNHCSRPTWFEGSRDVKTGTAAVLRQATGATDYIRVDDSSLMLSGFSIPWALVEEMPTDGMDFLFDEDILFFDPTWAEGKRIELSGDGSAFYLRSGAEVPLSYTGVSHYHGEETISVPGGEFKTVHVDYSLDLTIDSQATDYVIPVEVHLWLAPTVGVVRRLQNRLPFELSRYDDRGVPADDHETHRCAYRSLEESHPYRAPSGPFTVFVQSNRFLPSRQSRPYAASLSGTEEPVYLGAALDALERADDDYDIDHLEIVDVSVSPDRRSVAFSAEDPGVNTLHLLSIDDGETTELVLDTEDRISSIQLLSWSPDGKRIAYLVNSEDDEQHGLWVASAEGEPKNQKVGVALADAFWSPDARYLAFQEALAEEKPERESQIVISEPEKSTRTELSTPNLRIDRSTLTLAWSPDAKTVAFAAQELTDTVATEDLGLYLFRVDSKEVNAIEAGSVTPPLRWSPTMNLLAFLVKGRLTILAEDSQSFTTLSESGGDAGTWEWSSDGSRLAYIWRPASSEDHQLIAVTPNGDQPTIIDSGFISRVMWSPGEASLAYVKDAAWYSTSITTASPVRHISTNGATLGDCEGERSTQSPWSPDGSHLFFCSQEDGLILVQGDGAGRRIVSPDFGEERMQREDFVWSSDGSRVLFLARPKPESFSGYQLYSTSATRAEPFVLVSGTTYHSATVMHEHLPQ